MHTPSYCPQELRTRKEVAYWFQTLIYTKYSVESKCWARSMPNLCTDHTHIPHHIVERVVYADGGCVFVSMRVYVYMYARAYISVFRMWWSIIRSKLSRASAASSNFPISDRDFLYPANRQVVHFYNAFARSYASLLCALVHAFANCPKIDPHRAAFDRRESRFPGDSEEFLAVRRNVRTRSGA